MTYDQQIFEDKRTLDDARELVRDTTIRGSLRLVLAAPRLLRDALGAHERAMDRMIDQLRKRDRDYDALVGRRSVELEAAAREGYRQGVNAADERSDAIAQEASGIEPSSSPDVARPLELAAVYEAARRAQPRSVIAEAVLNRRGPGLTGAGTGSAAD